ncbi:peptidylprolyl isomerase [Bacteroides acidifaciens]|uniref:peptidylprolyl isomerase n=1 Tax=Bacteroides acidifaciens TaxID=85831 RepID=UPI0026F05768|nr:peptidylprolyl isomerase [Bacteroides acidifaciens]
MYKSVKFIVSIFILLGCSIVGSAGIKVTSDVIESPYDISARTEKRLDLNGMGCALLKIEIPIENVTFDGNIVGEIELHTNEYWIYMTDGSKQLKAHIPGQSNLLLEFAPLASLRTYSAVVEVIGTNNYSIDEAVLNYENRAKAILKDSTIIHNIRQEAYRHMLTTRDISHIMLPVGKSPDERVANKTKLDSIRQEILNGASFEDMAVKYSSDPSAKNNKGHMGWINHESLPYPFIEAAYATEKGNISAAFEDSPYGFHIIRVENEKKNPGKFRVRHIMKTTSKLSEQERSIKKMAIDSIYSLLINGGDFEAIAKVESEDPGSKKMGGKLPDFGLGMMVPEFENMVVSLKDGEISKPFTTAFGYHVVQRLESIPFPSYEEMLPTINKAIEKDSRRTEPRRDKLAKLRALYGIKLNKTNLSKAHDIITNGGGLNSSTIAKLKQDNSFLAKFGNQTLTISDVAYQLPSYNQDVKIAGLSEFDRVAYEQLDILTENIVRVQLVECPEYLNCLSE